LEVFEAARQRGTGMPLDEIAEFTLAEVKRLAE
jgi:hypothetical protein